MENKQNEDNTVVLLDEMGKEFEFKVIDMIEIDKEEYVILVPLKEEENKENEEDVSPENDAIILKVGEDENGEDVLYEIESDDEWDMVAQAWYDSMKDNGDFQ